MSAYEEFIKAEEIYLQSSLGGFVSARNDDRVIEQENQREWERFWVIPRDNGKVIFRSSHFQDKQISARDDSTVKMINNNLEWEEFIVEKQDETWAFKTWNNKYLAVSEQGAPLFLKDELSSECYFHLIVFKAREITEEPKPEEPVPETAPSSPSEIPKFNFSLKYKWGDQMPFDKLRIKDIFYWRNIYASLIILIAGLCLASLLGAYEYPILTLIARLFQLQCVVLCILPFAHKKIFNKDIKIPEISEFQKEHFGCEEKN